MVSPFFPSWNQLTASGSSQADLHQEAAGVAAEHFDRRVFIRGVVEVSNYCRENCAYCGMRRDNRKLFRRRAQLDELAELLVHQRPSAMTDVNIQGGEDPVAVRELVLPLIQILRRESPLGVSVCLGTLTSEVYAQLKAAGASIYIMKFEMANPVLYRRMQAPGSFEERLEHIRELARQGWRVSSGFIAGLPGQTAEEYTANFSLASHLPLSGCSVSPFIPGEETLLANSPAADIDLTLNSMALLRLMRPDWIIPSVSALNLAQPAVGYDRGLQTGANLVTINLTPDLLRQDYLLYRRDRYIMTEERILAAVERAGLVPSDVSLAEHFRKQASGGPRYRGSCTMRENCPPFAESTSTVNGPRPSTTN